jgi:hypothetical protein
MIPKRCCHPECTVQVTKSHIACVPHWRSADAATRHRVQYLIYGCRNIDEAREFLTRFFKKKKG